MLLYLITWQNRTEIMHLCFIYELIVVELENFSCDGKSGNEQTKKRKHLGSDTTLWHGLHSARCRVFRVNYRISCIITIEERHFQRIFSHSTASLFSFKKKIDKTFSRRKIKFSLPKLQLIMEGIEECQTHGQCVSSLRESRGDSLNRSNFGYEAIHFKLTTHFPVPKFTGKIWGKQAVKT